MAGLPPGPDRVPSSFGECGAHSGGWEGFGHTPVVTVYLNAPHSRHPYGGPIGFHRWLSDRVWLSEVRFGPLLRTCSHPVTTNSNRVLTFTRDFVCAASREFLHIASTTPLPCEGYFMAASLIRPRRFTPPDAGGAHPRRRRRLPPATTPATSTPLW